MENPCKIITFGDSITKGYTDIFRETITLEYSEKTVEVINEGVISETSSDGLARVASVIEQKPNVAVVGFGMNDWRKGVSPGSFRKNMSDIVDRLSYTFASFSPCARSLPSRLFMKRNALLFFQQVD